MREARTAALAPFEGEQRFGEHGRWCTGICGDSLLQSAEAGLQLVGTQLREEREGAQTQPFEHVAAGAGGRLGDRAEAGNAPGPGSCWSTWPADAAARAGGWPERPVRR